MDPVVAVVEKAADLGAAVGPALRKVAPPRASADAADDASAAPDDAEDEAVLVQTPP